MIKKKLWIHIFTFKLSPKEVHRDKDVINKEEPVSQMTQQTNYKNVFATKINLVIAVMG